MGVTAFDNTKSQREKSSSATTRVTPDNTYGSRAVTSNEVSDVKDTEDFSETQENDDVRHRFIGEKRAANLDKVEEATTRLDNLGVAREMEKSGKAKQERIEKLRKSDPVVATFNDDYKLERKSAKNWLKENVRGEYTNADTGDRIEVSKIGINEVTAHGSQDKMHMTDEERRNSLASETEDVAREDQIFLNDALGCLLLWIVLLMAIRESLIRRIWRI